MNEEIRKNEEIRDDELENVSGGAEQLLQILRLTPCPSCGGWMKEEREGFDVYKVCRTCGYKELFATKG